MAVTGLEPGSTLGGYRILTRIRAGAMGVLYLARRVGPAGFERPVAIKVIHDHLAQNRRFSRMFIDEAKLSAQIDDPNVVRVEAFGEADGRHFLVMEYVHGCSLAQVIGLLRPHGGLSVDHAVAIGMQICSGLHGAHEATDAAGRSLGIVHRDVSPHNILVSFKGSVRIIDFGIAKARQVGGQTRTGSLRGKLAYMPPEQARSARTVDRRADLYAAGLVIWEMLTGRRLFDADTDIAILNQIRNPNIVAPSTIAKGVPRAVDEVVLKALAQDPADRPATGADMQRMLGEAHPDALRVMPADLAALMAKVRAFAMKAADAPDDPASLYGQEVRRSVSTFAQSEDASTDGGDTPLAGQSDASPLADALDGDDATVAMVDRPVRPPSTQEGAPAYVVEDDRTQRLLAQTRPAARAQRGPNDVRIPTPPPSPPSGHAFPTPPPSRPSGHAFPPPALAGPASDREPDAWAGARRWVAENPWAPIAGIVVVALGLPLGVFFAIGVRAPAKAPQASDATASSAVAMSAPAPPPVVPAAHVLGGESPRRPMPWREGEDPFMLVVQGEDGAPKARRALEERGIDKLAPEELRLLLAICKKQRDAACVARVEQLAPAAAASAPQREAASKGR